MMRPLNILVLAQTPPPLHGQSAMTQHLLEGTYGNIRLHHVRMAFSDTINEVGAFKWKKLVHVVTTICRVVWMRIATGSTVLYYPPAGPKLNAFYRDVAVLLPLRWMFRHTVFHFYAAGISDLYPRLTAVGKWLYRQAYWKPDCGICLFSAGLKDPEFLHAGMSLVVPCGIPDERTTPASGLSTTKDALVVTFLAMLSEAKGVFVFLEGCSHLINRGLAVKPVLVGWPESDEFEVRLRQRIVELGLEGILERHGKTVGEEKSAIYQRTHVFCFPTHYPSEGSPLVLLEAMQFGLPVVATKWRGCEDLVSDGETGFLVPTNDPEAVAEKLQLLLENDDLCAAMGKAARERYDSLFTLPQFRSRVEEALLAAAHHS